MKSPLTIEQFWKSRLALVRAASPVAVRGWITDSHSLKSFREAPLIINNDLSTSDPAECSLILVSAPGAVGKSTLARQISAETGAILIDLALADPVGGNTTSGGLAKSGLYSQWDNNQTALLIDGLDEARLRVTQEAFEAFLNDLAEIVKNRQVPTVLFGRTGAIQDAWVQLCDCEVDLSVVEIGFYGREASIDFAIARLEENIGDVPNDAQKRAIELLLDGLRAETGTDGDRFAGYAPVLQAVADRVMLEDNPASLVAQIEKGERPVTLQSVVDKIMDREHKKIENISLSDSSLIGELYLKREQLERLTARVYGLAPPPLRRMSPDDAQIYSNALDTWLPEHPFLNGASKASSAVFDAAISASALQSPEASKLAADIELSRGSAANPFLSEFYLNEDESEQRTLPPEHLGIIYASFRATLSIGDSASLEVEGNDEAEDEEALRANVEINVARPESSKVRQLSLQTEQVGTIRLGKYVEDVDINTKHATVEIGVGSEALLVSPINIQCDKLSLRSEKLIVEEGRAGAGGSVYLEANLFSGDQQINLPITRGKVEFAVSWPNASVHPWTNFSVEPTKIENPLVREALRRLRKFVTAFRSHSKGNLARYRDKLDHERMTKGTGKAVLEALKDDRIVVADGAMYYLDPNRLGQIAGGSFSDIASQHFSPETVEYISRAIAGK